MNFIEFLQSVGRSILDGIRRNKLPASLSVVAVVLTTAFALTSDFDERPRYRRFILPEIEKAENQFFEAMGQAEQESREPSRMLYFLEGHRLAKKALRVIRSERPMTMSGRKAQSELFRYYEIADE